MAPSLSKYSALLFLFSYILVSANSANAVQIDKIYSATVPIASQQKRDRLAGFDQALSRVLVKASGQYNDVTAPEFISAFLPAEPLVQTFSYRENPAYQDFLQSQIALDSNGTTGAEVEDLEGEDNTMPTNNEEDVAASFIPLPYLLDVSFASSIVDDKMAERGIAVWGSVRPSVLVWVVHELNGERAIVGTSDEGELVDHLLQLADQRGVPLYLPVADLDDVSAVDIADLWGLFPEAVSQASARYRPDSVVMMRVYQLGNGLWSGNWSLSLKQAFEEGAHYDSTLPLLVESFVSDIAAKLSSHYAVAKIPGEEGGEFNLEVDQVNTFADYVNIQRYLESLPPVSAIKIKWALSGRVGFQVSLVGTKNQFFEHVDLGGKLKKDLRDQSLLHPQGESAETSFSFPSNQDQGQGERVLLFQSSTPELNDYTDTSEYYIWTSGHSLLERPQMIDKE